MQTIHSNSSLARWVGSLTFSYSQNFIHFTFPLEGDDNHPHPMVDNLLPSELSQGVELSLGVYHR